MAKVDIESFAEKELTRIYIADRLAEAAHVETALTDHGIDYAVEIEPFRKILLGVFPMESAGAAFYVLSGQAPFARKALSVAGLKAGLTEEDAE